MRNIFAILFCICTVGANAQKQSFRKQTIILRPALGYDFALNTIKANASTDYLSDMNTNGLSFPSFSATFFIKHNWGLEVSIYSIIHKDGKKNGRLFDQQFEKEFAAQYYILQDTLSYDLSEPFSRISGTVGIVYRIEKNRFVCIPKIFAGVVTVDMISKSYYLKEKNRNNILHIRYGNWQSSKDVFLLGAGASFIYRLTGKIGISMDMSCSMNNPHTTYLANIENLVTNEFTQVPYRYDKSQYRVNAGLGVAISFGKRR